MSVPDCLKLARTDTFAVASCRDPQGNCDPWGYPRSLDGAWESVEFIQTPVKILERFHFGLGNREVFTDGRKIPDDIDPGGTDGRWVTGRGTRLLWTRQTMTKGRGWTITAIHIART